MSDEALLEFFKKNSGWFEIGNFMLDAIRYLSFGFVKILYTIAKSSNELYDKTFELLDFTKWVGIDEFITENKLAMTAILALAIFFLGVFLILNHEKKRNIVSTILIAFVSITSTAYVMNEINLLLIEGKNAIIGTAQSEMSSANQIARGYIYDLVYIDTKVGIENFDQSDGESLASYHLSEAGIDHLMKAPTSKINTKVKRKNLSGASQAIFSNTLETLHEYDHDIPKESIRKLEEGSVIGGFGREEYYQYHVETMPFIIALISLILIFVFVSYKTFKMIYELVFSKILLIFHAGNLTGGEVTLKILDSIKNTYLILLFTAVLMKVYTIGANAITMTFASNGWISAIFLVFLSLATIDAPNVVAKITGIDLGVNNEKMAMLGLLMMSGRGLNSIKNAGQSLVGGGQKLLSGDHSHTDSFRDGSSLTKDLSGLDSHIEKHQGSSQRDSDGKVDFNHTQDKVSYEDKENSPSVPSSFSGEADNHPSIQEDNYFSEMNEEMDIGSEILDEYMAGGFDSPLGTFSQGTERQFQDDKRGLDRMEKEIDQKMDKSLQGSIHIEKDIDKSPSMPTYRSHPLERGASRFNDRSNAKGGERAWVEKERDLERKDKR